MKMPIAMERTKRKFLIISFTHTKDREKEKHRLPKKSRHSNSIYTRLKFDRTTTTTKNVYLGSSCLMDNNNSVYK